MESIIQSTDIKNMERRYRANLFNALSGFKGAHLIGTANKEGQTNLALFNSVVHIGANPPYLGFILRPTTVPRHTYSNIKEIGFYTINHAPVEHLEKTHQTSAKYDERTSEFDACGFTPQSSSLYPAPYVAECRVKIGLEYVEEHLIQANQTHLIVGKVIELLLPEGAAGEKGHLNLSELGSLAVVGLDEYYKTEKIARLPYARP